MSPRRFSWRVSAAALVLVVVTAFLIGLQLVPAAGERRLSAIRSQCLEEAALVAEAARAELTRLALSSAAGLGNPDVPSPAVLELQRLADAFAGSVGGLRITFIAPDGRVLADSHEHADVMENHGRRPEVLTPGEVVPRLSRTLGVEMLYAARVVAPLSDVGAPASVGFARVAVPLEDVAAEVSRLRNGLLRGAIIAMGGGLVLAVVLSRQLTRPLRVIADSLAAFGSGDYSQRLPEGDADEIGQLAHVVNVMADQLAEREELLREAIQQDQVILGAMEEGVLAVDADSRVVALNEAARSLLDVIAEDPQGRPLTEITRVPDVIQAVTACLAAREKVHVEVDVQRGKADLRLAVSVVPLLESSADAAQPSTRGAVAVLHDLTELTRLEKVRRDFVANVSHELKTPLTAVKGFIEAVRDDPEMTVDTRESFLERAGKHTDRLADIVADLLSLARLESGGGAGAIFAPLDMAQVVRSVVGSYRITANQRGVIIELELPPEPLAYQGDARALETALSNLVSNALKYSTEGDAVTVRLRQDAAAVYVEVEDQGPGIPAHEQERIFERFYRVDKDRSRSVGGTGLGLSIVKHAVSMHGGQVRVISEAGAGSRFEIRLPLRLDIGPEGQGGAANSPS